MLLESKSALFYGLATVRSQVVYSLLTWTPIGVGFVLGPFNGVSFLVSFQFFCNDLAEEERTGCFTFNVVWLCIAPITKSAMGWSMVHKCGIS